MRLFELRSLFTELLVMRFKMGGRKERPSKAKMIIPYHLILLPTVVVCKCNHCHLAVNYRQINTDFLQNHFDKKRKNIDRETSDNKITI